MKCGAFPQAMSMRSICPLQNQPNLGVGVEANEPGMCDQQFQAVGMPALQQAHTPEIAGGQAKRGVERQRLPVS